MKCFCAKKCLTPRILFKEVHTYHKVVVFGGFCLKLLFTGSNADLNIPSELAHFSFTHLTHNPGNT